MEGVYSGFAYFMLILAAVFAVFGFFNMRERVPLMSREEIKETSVLESLKYFIRKTANGKTEDNPNKVKYVMVFKSLTKWVETYKEKGHIRKETK